MIRKPTEKDFREGTAVTVLRETKRISVESSKGVGEGLRKIYLYWFGGIMAFGLVTSLFSTFASDGGLPFLVIAGLTAFLVWVFKADRNKRSAPSASFAPPPASPSAAPALQKGIYRLDRGVLARKVTGLGVPALLFFALAGLGIFQTVLTLTGIGMFALAALLVMRAFGKPNLIEYDHRSIKVCGLLGESEMLWADVDDVSMRVFSRFNLWAIFTSGGRRNIIISGSRSRLGGPAELLVAVDLLGLKHEELVQLLTALICTRAAGGVVVPSWQPQGTATSEVSPTPASDPRESFDPDAIMSRYLAEREQVIAATRPDLAPAMSVAPARRTFGRKAV